MNSLTCHRYRYGFFAHLIKRASRSSVYRFNRSVERQWLASVPASPPAEPDVPEFPGTTPQKPRTPELPPDDVPPEIDDPQPDGVPEPVREPPVMPTPTASA